jgi:Tfp pilus assembly protein PilE
MKILRLKKGFGLIEVLIASSILIMFLAAGVVLISASYKNVVVGKHRLQAMLLARQELEQKQAARDNYYFAATAVLWEAIFVPGCVDTPYSDTLGPGTPFFTKSTCTANYNPGVTGKKFTVTVSWSDYGQQHSIKSYSYLFDWQSFPGAAPAPVPIPVSNNPISELFPMAPDFMEQWTVTGCSPTAHWDCVNENKSTLDLTNFITKAMAGGTSAEDEFNMTDFAMTPGVLPGPRVDSITVWYHCGTIGPNPPSLTSRIDFGGYQTSQPVSCSGTPDWTSNTWDVASVSGNHQTNLNNLKVEVTATDSAPPGGGSRKINSIYAEGSYTYWVNP